MKRSHAREKRITICFLIEGELDVWLGGSAHPTSRVRAPAIVGETSLIDHQPANATLRVATPQAKVLRAPSDAVLQLVYYNAAWADALIRLSTRYLALRALRACELFKSLPIEEEEHLLEMMQMVVVLRGETMDERIPGWRDAGWLLARGRAVAEKGGCATERENDCTANARCVRCTGI